MASHNKTALVTGAGTGVGRAVALALLKDGYRVALAGRRKEMLEQTASLAGVAAKSALIVPTDVGKPDQVKALFAKIQQEFERIDVIFNNAGGNAPGVAFEDLSFEKWQSVVDVNLTGMFLCAQAAFRMMKDQARAAGASSTTARSRRTRRGRDRRPTPRPSTGSPA
jgi:NAD(P)-dependent dehydrogenase (short-subunit alcohol dehydrogenase family)